MSDDPTTSHNHHLLPGEFRAEFEQVWADAGQEFEKHALAVTMYEFQHIGEGGIHPDWNSEWQLFFDTAQLFGCQPTPADVIGHMYDLMDQYEIGDRTIHPYSATENALHDPFDGQPYIPAEHIDQWSYPDHVNYHW